MSYSSKGKAAPSRRTIGTPISLVIVVVVALFTVAAALIVAGVNPAWDGVILAAFVALGIIATAVALAVVLAIVHRFRRAVSNDDWVYW